MEITTVCKYNQARSIISAAAIRKFFPLISVRSLGIQASVEGSIPIQIRTIAKSWGLSILEKTSTPISVASIELSNSDLIISVDEEITLFLRELYPNSPIVNLQETALVMEFTPHDPSGMSKNQTEVELAKIVALTTQKLISFTNQRSKYSITSLIPQAPEAEQNTIAAALKKTKEENGFILDLNIRTPEIESWRDKQVELRELTANYLDSLAAETASATVGPIIFAPSYEASLPELVWLSRELLTLILDLANRAPVTLLTAPIKFFGHAQPDAYLASISASSVEVIS